MVLRNQSPVDPCATCPALFCLFSCDAGDEYFISLDGEPEPPRPSLLSRIFIALGGRLGGHF